MERLLKFRAYDKVNKKYTDSGIYLSNTTLELDCIRGLVIEQFTGFVDNKGEYIFEGDILNSNYFKNGQVVFWRGGWHINTGKDCHHSFNTSIHSFEVIGTIHDKL